MGYFKLEKNSGGQYYFNLKAGNHETILTSQMYKSKGAAIGGISSVRENSPLDGQYNRLPAANGEFRFTLEAKNGEIIGRSENYTTEAGRDNGIESVKRNGPDANLDDRTGE